MLDIRKTFGRDHDKVNNGVKVILDADEAYVTIRHRSSEAMEKAVEALSRADRMLWDAANVARGKGRNIIARVVANGAVVDWGGLSDGKPLKYSPANAVKILANPMYDPFLEKILTLIADDELFGLDLFEEDSKNS